MNGYPRGYPRGRGYNHCGGGGGPGPASSHSSPSSGGGGQRVPYDNVTSSSLPPLHLHFSQLLQINQQQQHGIDSMYYPPPRLDIFWSWDRLIHTNFILIFTHSIRSLL